MRYWQSVVTVSTRRLGPAHGTTLAARDRLAIAYESAGRFGDAIATFARASRPGPRPGTRAPGQHRGPRPARRRLFERLGLLGRGRGAV